MKGILSRTNIVGWLICAGGIYTHLRSDIEALFRLICCVHMRERHENIHDRKGARRRTDLWHLSVADIGVLNLGAIIMYHDSCHSRESFQMHLKEIQKEIWRQSPEIQKDKSSTEEPQLDWVGEVGYI